MVVVVMPSHPSHHMESFLYENKDNAPAYQTAMLHTWNGMIKFACSDGAGGREWHGSFTSTSHGELTLVFSCLGSAGRMSTVNLWPAGVGVWIGRDSKGRDIKLTRKEHMFYDATAGRWFRSPMGPMSSQE